MKYALFANGELMLHPQLTPDWTVVAVDGGMRHLKRADFLIGDLDSIEEMPTCETVQFPREKDETDLQLALKWVIDRGAKIVRIYGALGGRTDHTLGNIYLLGHEMCQNLDIALIGDTEQIRVLFPGTTTLTGTPGDTLTLLPLGGSVENITTHGLKYPLQNETLHVTEIRGISNVLEEEKIELTHSNGLLIIFHTTCVSPCCTFS